MTGRQKIAAGLAGVALLVGGGFATRSSQGGNGVDVFVGSTPTPSGAPACTQTFTTGTITNSPFNGDNVNTAVQGAGSSAAVICFASGTYAGVDLYTAHPTARVILRPANGAAVTMGAVTMNGVSQVTVQDFTGSSTLNDFELFNSSTDVHDVTIKNNKVIGTGSAIVNNTGTNRNILVQGNLLTGQTCTAPCDEKRLKVVGNTGCPSGITITGNEMTLGNVDGMQTGSNCGVTISNNYIHDVIEDPGGNHVDGIQFTGDTSDTVSGNYIKSMPTGLVDYDGPGHTNVITNNVIQNVTGVGSGQINMGSEADVTVTHNTIITGPNSDGIDDINFGSKTGDIQSTNVIVEDNIAPGGIAQDGDQAATFTTRDYNICGSGVTCVGAHSLSSKVAGTDYTFVGGATPTTFAGVALASGVGIAAAHDGTNIGVNP